MLKTGSVVLLSRYKCEIPVLIKPANIVKIKGVLEKAMVMSKAENNEELDADILQSKADVLRARDIIPGGKEPETQNTEQEPKSQTSREITISSETVEKSTKDKGQGKTEIPRFDLAEDIMAEHRKSTSIRRKAPEKKAEAQIQEPSAEQIGYTVEQPIWGLSKEEQIIAEIVARDIERLCRGGTLGVH